MKNKLTLGIALVAVVIAIAAFLQKGSEAPVVGVNPTPQILYTQEFLNGVVYGKVNATSSSVATYTLTANDIAPEGSLYQTISFAKSGAVATTTWTLPATSTLSHVLPSVGQRSQVCFAVATSSSANPGLTLAGGTGWDLETSSTTATGLTINGGSVGCMNVIRRADSDISGSLTIFRDAD